MKDDEWKESYGPGDSVSSLGTGGERVEVKGIAQRQASVTVWSVEGRGDNHRGLPLRDFGKPSRYPDIFPARASNAFWNGASGARRTPAPIWPTPGSRWAMPVLMTG